MGSLFCKRRPSRNYNTIILGAGCFWCVEACFRRMDGVKNAVSGYCGGEHPNPTYKSVKEQGEDDYADVVKLTYDPKTVSLHEILSVFFTIHDPTSINKQGKDVGKKYKSVIFYTSTSQRAEALSILNEFNVNSFDNKIVTELLPEKNFHPAEMRHQDYLTKNFCKPGYVQKIVKKKVSKFTSLFKDNVKKEFKEESLN